jgi:hypothetical protein
MDDEHPRWRPGLGTYVLLLGLIALVCVVAMGLLGPNASTKKYCFAVSEMGRDPQPQCTH